MTLPSAVSGLLAAGRIEAVPTDLPSARQRVARARDKLDTAIKISTIDSEVAYVTAYDAARIAISAHMLAAGFRVRATNGAHEATGIYAEAMINDPSVREFQRMRRRRNKAEYDDIIVSLADVQADLVHATGIVEAVAAML